MTIPALKKYWRRFGHYGAAVLAGAVATPLILFTVEVWPVTAPVFLYGILSFFFAYLLPKPSWRWGCWVTLGIPIAVALAILFRIVEPPQSDPSGVPLPYVSFVGLMMILGYAPAFAGSLVGALFGSFVGRQRQKSR